MNNYYCPYSPTLRSGICFVDTPCYEYGANAWVQCEYNNVCYNVFLTPRDDYNGGGVNINACKSDIMRLQKYKEFTRAFDYALYCDAIPDNNTFQWIGSNTCCRYSYNPDIVDGYVFSNAPTLQYNDPTDMIRDWTGERADYDLLYPLGWTTYVGERMRGQADFVGIYGNWGKCGAAGRLHVCLWDFCGCAGVRSLDVCNGDACQQIGDNSGVVCADNIGWVWKHNRPSSCFEVCMSSCGCYLMHFCLTQCPNFEFVEHEPCETDAVLYVGMPNYLIASIPIKRVKCTLETTPTISVMANDNVNSRCWNDRAWAFAEQTARYKFCFITFPNELGMEDARANIIPRILSNAVFIYMCSYKCGDGQYIATCKSSLNIIKNMNEGRKVNYYTFQGYSVGGAYL